MACFIIMVENLDHTYSHPYVEEDGSVSRTLVKPHNSHPYSHAVLVDFHTASEGQKIHALLLAREFPEISFETSPGSEPASGQGRRWTDLYAQKQWFQETWCEDTYKSPEFAPADPTDVGGLPIRLDTEEK